MNLQKMGRVFSHYLETFFKFLQILQGYEGIVKNQVE